MTPLPSSGSPDPASSGGAVSATPVPRRPESRLVSALLSPAALLDAETGLLETNAAWRAELGDAERPTAGEQLFDGPAPAALQALLDGEGCDEIELETDSVASRCGRRYRLTRIVDRPASVAILVQTVEVSARAEEQWIASLTHELDHRVKNSLALLRAISEATLRADPTPRKFVPAFQGRLDALAGVHDVLARSGWRGADLEDVLRVSAPARGIDRILAKGCAAFLSVPAAQPLALALHELYLHASEYGALSATAGRVHISWTVEEGVLELEWREHGSPETESSHATRAGLDVVNSALAYELGGGATIELGREGLHARIWLPLEAWRGRAPIRSGEPAALS